MKELLTNSDKAEIERIINFSNGLVIVDQEYANKFETILIQRSASHYINAYYGLNDFTEAQNAPIIQYYNEENKYYKALQDTYGIDPAISRKAKHLSILKSTNNILNRDEHQLFYECYYDSLNHFNKVLSTKAFKNHPYYSNFIKLYMTWCTIQKYLTRTLNSFFNIDTYNLRTLKNSFISVGLDYFDDLPINYQRRVLKKVNDLIMNKGTNKCFSDILDIFGLDNVDIYKYSLVKRYTRDINGSLKPSLTFYKTIHDKKLNVNEDERTEYDEFVKEDKYWIATKEEILKKEFNSVTTKYIGVESAMDFNKDVLKLSYFINLLEKLVLNKNHSELYFYNKNISTSKINIFDGFILLVSLSLKMNGYKDKVLKNVDVANYVYGYTNEDNSVEINSLVKEIEFLLSSDHTLEVSKKEKLLKFLNDKFEIKKLDTTNYSLEEFLAFFNSNEEMREELNNWIVNSSNYEVYKRLNMIYDLETKTKLNANMFRNYETYSEYIMQKDFEMYKYAQVDDIEDEELRFIEYKAKIIEISESLSNLIYDNEVSDALAHNPFYGVTSYLQYYINTLILLFKSYTVDLKDTKLNYAIKNKKDNTMTCRDYINKSIYKTEGEFIGLNDSIKIIFNGKEI